MAAEHWDLKDSLRQMTEKFNAAVDALNELENSSTQINSATTEKLSEIQRTLNQSIEEIQQELSNKIDSVTATDLGLGNVDNTSDIDKPVSTAQQQAIEEATSEFASTAEVSDDELNTENLYDPEVSAPVKLYIERRLAELLGTTVGYEIASEEQLGIVKSGGDISVNPTTGKMYVTNLNNILRNISSLQTGLSNVVESLESNNTATSELSKLQGDLTELETSDKNSIVSSINSMNSVLDGIAERVAVLERKLSD